MNRWTWLALLAIAPLLLAATCKIPDPPPPAATGGSSTGGALATGGAMSTGGTGGMTECRYLPSGRSDVQRQVVSRVVGGTPAPPGAAPWIAALMIGGHQFCAATVIGERAALTAAHCQVDPSADTLLVGTQDLTSGGRRIGITETRNHWRWTSTTSGHDVAVLILADPVGVPPIELARVAPDDGTALVLGWGRTSESGSGSSVLLQAELPLVPWAQCWQAYPLALDDTMLCAGGKDLDACYGDSGGPLVRDGKQLGIVSFGRGCGRPGFPGVNTSVPAVLDWVEACAAE